MSQAFEEQARRYNVNPIGNIGDALPESMRQARLDFAQRGGKWRYAGPIGNITGQMAPPITARGYAMTAKLDLPAIAVTGPVFAYGGQLGGMGLYLRDGKPVFLMTTLQGETSEVASSETLPKGSTAIELDVSRTQAASLGLDAPADFAVTIKAGGRVIAQRQLSFALPFTFGIAETFGIGIDDGSPLLPGAKSGVPFAGRISDVMFDFAGSK